MKSKIKKIEKIVNKFYKKLDIGHNVNHMVYTLKLAEYISKKEHADLSIVKLGALLHQFHDASTARKIMEKTNFDKETIHKVVHCVECISRKSIKKARSIEAKVVFDADKLQMIGPIGIFRFLMNKKLDRKVLEEAKKSEKEVYEKYLQTKTAKKMAKNPHKIALLFFKHTDKFLKIKSF
jgi:uncharacterized protein